MDRKLKVYFAGPDVFRKNAIEYFESIKDLCDYYKLIALIPYDGSIQKSDSIYAYNIFLLNQCDVVVANISPFRGASLDPGTALEIGYAKALNKPVIAYNNYVNNNYKDRVTEDMINISKEYRVVEDFCLYDNLMIMHSCDFIHDEIRGALSTVANLYKFLLERL